MEPAYQEPVLDPSSGTLRAIAYHLQRYMQAYTDTVQKAIFQYRCFETTMIPLGQSEPEQENARAIYVYVVQHGRVTKPPTDVDLRFARCVMKIVVTGDDDVYLIVPGDRVWEFKRCVPESIPRGLFQRHFLEQMRRVAEMS